ncbi:hypothetical protein [Streptomyces sp900116325]|uniref:hypothetical protein n=1 Tax=Streptomyces sp. 900116325 TaxID=3154295 RepID=UPI0033AE9913
MKVTRSGYVLEFPHILDELRATAAQCKNPAHLNFVTTAITAFDEEGPDAEPFLKGCPQHTARLIFEEVTEAYITTEQATRNQTRDSTLVRDFQLPYPATAAPRPAGQSTNAAAATPPAWTGCATS